mmetsp:Transcript_69872/g.158552  ORF Transcript_69872/g.158552 Transcript_69872/m.158552 type:complete len:200 (-) Transcript_69872:296-895(-)
MIVEDNPRRGHRDEDSDPKDNLQHKLREGVCVLHLPREVPHDAAPGLCLVGDDISGGHRRSAIAPAHRALVRGVVGDGLCRLLRDYPDPGRRIEKHEHHEARGQAGVARGHPARVQTRPGEHAVVGSDLQLIARSGLLYPWQLLQDFLVEEHEEGKPGKHEKLPSAPDPEEHAYSVDGDSVRDVRPDDGSDLKPSQWVD